MDPMTICAGGCISSCLSVYAWLMFVRNTWMLKLTFTQTFHLKTIGVLVLVVCVMATFISMQDIPFCSTLVDEESRRRPIDLMQATYKRYHKRLYWLNLPQSGFGIELSVSSLNIKKMEKKLTIVANIISNMADFISLVLVLWFACS